MKRWLINLLAVVGTLSLGNSIFNIVHYQLDAENYLTNCQKVQPGMTLIEAKQIMGDYSWYERANRSELWTFLDNDTTKQYFLNYPSPAMASEGTEIFFDPKTQIVTGIVCGETNIPK